MYFQTFHKEIYYSGRGRKNREGERGKCVEKDRKDRAVRQQPPVLLSFMQCKRELLVLMCYR